MAAASATLMWHAAPVSRVLSDIQASADGLATPEATLRLKRFGTNALPRAEPDSVWQLGLRQVKNPLALVLSGSGLLAFALGKPTDGAVVVAVVVLNAIVGALQEYRAMRAMQALDDLVAENARVLRDGSVRQVPASELVPGDVVLLEAGDRVPADGRVLSARNLGVDEAALTGESLAVAKQASPCRRVRRWPSAAAWSTPGLT